jgi:hypothetical protein
VLLLPRGNAGTSRCRWACTCSPALSALACSSSVWMSTPAPPNWPGWWVTKAPPEVVGHAAPWTRSRREVGHTKGAAEELSEVIPGNGSRSGQIQLRSGGRTGQFAAWRNITASSTSL